MESLIRGANGYLVAPSDSNGREFEAIISREHFAWPADPLSKLGQREVEEGRPGTQSVRQYVTWTRLVSCEKSEKGHETRGRGEGERSREKRRVSRPRWMIARIGDKVIAFSTGVRWYIGGRCCEEIVPRFEEASSWCQRRTHSRPPRALLSSPFISFSHRRRENKRKKKKERREREETISSFRSVWAPSEFQILRLIPRVH